MPDALRAIDAPKIEYGQLSPVLIVIAMPRLAATAWDSIGIQADALVAAWSEADLARIDLR